MQDDRHVLMLRFGDHVRQNIGDKLISGPLVANVPPRFLSQCDDEVAERRLKLLLPCHVGLHACVHLESSRTMSPMPWIWQILDEATRLSFGQDPFRSVRLKNSKGDYRKQNCPSRAPRLCWDYPQATYQFFMSGVIGGLHWTSRRFRRKTRRKRCRTFPSKVGKKNTPSFNWFVNSVERDELSNRRGENASI